ncbi:DUF948 domain-containing protein [Latilactobacillus fuchuensis]|jgi:uncharacterized protein YoxC|uniref:Extracellular protein n=2 Tax=Latilactobacillus fuchuensis TaxID=164393 RepID=A0A2N9DTY0_9LACO|nr:DUF948 domain-containing protein [Latilactobacillus fuchuensis]KRL61011.1 hypothetical protein FC69_GL001025 [Latilactobacillus fuchuensis DSM 14340 = JCM 11249]MCP8856624.1 DUF948 domain-containing protein [Latilactobacillus fuchuensis]SPC37061.1 conserved hypothetical protein [Latilactobacillus fuchuensis]
MTGGQIAALIAAGAFAVLVVFLIVMLLKITKVLTQVTQTVAEANKSVTVITEDVDILAKEVEGLLNKANVLLDDVNGKVANLDPVFKAAGDLGESVADLNAASRNLTTKVSSVGKTAAKATMASKISASALKFYQNKKQTTDKES